ncbi:MAG: prefoldin subunit alpha [Candidatus Hydrothermarchaeales archaeon]
MEDKLETLQEFELYKAQIKTLTENLELIEVSINELQNVNEGLKALKDAKKGSEILVPMGADSFVNAKVTDTKNVIIGLGAGVATKKSVDEAMSDIEGRIKELEDIKKKSTDKLQFYTKKFEEIAPHVQEIIEDIQKEG